MPEFDLLWKLNGDSCQIGENITIEYLNRNIGMSLLMYLLSIGIVLTARRLWSAYFAWWVVHYSCHVQSVPSDSSVFSSSIPKSLKTKVCWLIHILKIAQRAMERAKLGVFLRANVRNEVIRQRNNSSGHISCRTDNRCGRRVVKWRRQTECKTPTSQVEWRLCVRWLA